MIKTIKENQIKSLLHFCQTGKFKTKDPGEHYRFTYSRRLTPKEIDNGIVELKLDPYRIIKVYKISDPAIQHALKKLLCPGTRGKKSLIEDIEEVICSLQRLVEMLDEDSDGKI